MYKIRRTEKIKISKLHDMVDKDVIKYEKLWPERKDRIRKPPNRYRDIN